MITAEIKAALRVAQRNELTEYYVYSKLSAIERDRKHADILQTIANEEKAHAAFWETKTGEAVVPSRLKVFFYIACARVLGITFAVKLMENGEKLAQVNYEKIAQVLPEAKRIEKEEQAHEEELIGMIDEVRLKYVGSMILGLNDALVELTGALAGFTLALQNTRLIAVTGLITGIAASLSMAASEYLSTKAEGEGKDPLKAALYTGIMYVITVVLLILPFFTLANVYLALAATLIVVIIIITFFTFYISVAQEVPFKKRFLEMAGVSLGVAVITFGIGFLVREFLGVEV